MYSLPTRITLAALTMASAASMAPTRPLVSTIPSASMVMSSASVRRGADYIRGVQGGRGATSRLRRAAVPPALWSHAQRAARVDEDVQGNEARTRSLTRRAPFLYRSQVLPESRNTHILQ